MSLQERITELEAMLYWAWCQYDTMHPFDFATEDDYRDNLRYLVYMASARTPADAPPNGAASTGALKATGVPEKTAAAPVGHDCCMCDLWIAPEGAAIGACPPLEMNTVARGGGCVDSFVRKESDG